MTPIHTSSVRPLQPVHHPCGILIQMLVHTQESKVTFNYAKVLPVILSWGHHPRPWQSSTECQWSKKLHLRPLPLGVALAWTATPSMPRADPCPGEGQDHSHRLLRLLQKNVVSRVCMGSSPCHAI